MNYVKAPPRGVDRETRDKALEIGRPLTPKSERPRASWGSLAVSLQAARGLCPRGKCLRKEGHSDSCWPV